jgi:1-acyl-sn-glycerol-3-phosphate acyltransferase
MTQRDPTRGGRREHRDPQMELLFDKNPISDEVFESKRDYLSLEEVLEALDLVKGLPPMKAAAALVSKLGVERLKLAMQRALASRRDRVIDEFGLDEQFLRPLEPIGKWFHDHYFRVESEGLHHIPDTGRCLLVANHSGTLPYDAAMVVVAVRYQHPSQRRVRPLVEDFIYHLPFLGIFMSRVGAVRACQENAQRLLEGDHATLVFPEGVKGIGKLYSKKYRLQRFGRGGAVRLAAATGSPMIPVSIVGAEESMPLLSKVSWLAKPLGLPYIPITPTLPWLGPLGLVPLPTKWYIDFGEPIELPEDREALLADRVAMNRLNEELRRAVQRLIDKRLTTRTSIFGFSGWSRGGEP